MVLDARTIPLDSTSAAELAATGLDYATVPDDGEGFRLFHSAVDRGFLAPRSTPEQVASASQSLAYRRKVGVYDRGARTPESPVATVDSWVAQLTTSPQRTVPMWAISAVTVSPTHRRRGIARAMLLGELRAARDAGVPMAGLTVSEATIYGRWGFSPAVYTSDWSIDTRRARWIGPVPQGRLDFVEQEEMPAILGAVYERTRLRRGGRIEGWPGLWVRTAGLRPGAEDAAKMRAVVYRGDDGAERGILVYSLTERADDHSAHELAVRALFADGADAEAALWRFAIEHDLVATVTASLRPVDDPVRWMVSDQRAARVSVTDHHWLRILDVPAALSARSWAADDSLVIRVDDPLGFAGGTWRLGTEGGELREAEATDAASDVSLGVDALASLYLGGVSAAVLAAAGRLTAEPDVVRRLDALFRAAEPPLLDIWY